MFTTHPRSPENLYSEFLGFTAPKQTPFTTPHDREMSCIETPRASILQPLASCPTRTVSVKGVAREMCVKPDLVPSLTYGASNSEKVGADSPVTHAHCRIGRSPSFGRCRVVKHPWKLRELSDNGDQRPPACFLSNH
jgi:hypothetical protein